MNTSEILELVKIDLMISTTAYDTLLRRYVEEAVQAIGREGITLDQNENDDRYSVEDAVLIGRYAAYLFRSRDQNSGMPRHLRYLLNNRLFSEKGKTEDAST